GAAALDVPALVLDAVELEAERVTGRDEEQLPDVRVGLRPDQLPAPGLLDPPRLDGPAIETLDVRRGERLLRHRPILRRQERGMLGEILLATAQVLRCVHGQPAALVPEAPAPPLGRELRERARLVVAPLGQASDRLLPEDVDAAADPVRQRGRLLEAENRVVVVE